MTYFFHNLGRYYEPNIGVSFNSIEFWKRLLEYVFFSGKWTEFTPHTLIFYPYFFATKCRRPLIIKTMNSVRSNNLITKKSDDKNSASFTIVTILLRRNPHYWPQLFIGDIKFSLETPSLSSETPSFSSSFPKELSFSHKFWFSNRSIFATLWV